MASIKPAEGVAHKIPDDLKSVLTSDESLLERWNDLTPLARNEWICWVITVKLPETRAKHIERVKTDILTGKRRPCCWVGCVHRTDKPISRSAQWVLDKQAGKTT